MKKLFAILLSTVVLLAACGNSNTSEETSEVRIGYFPNLTHIATIVALQNGYFEEAFGEDITVSTQTFPNGSAFMEALSTDAFDLGTVGPTPATTTFSRNQGHEIIAGAVNGGAVLVSDGDANISSVEDLDGARVAIPTIGSTQDIMLRKALEEVGLAVEDAGGTVSLVPQAPADTATLFEQGNVEVAATQEPWGVYLETTVGGQILMDETEFGWGMDSTSTVVTANKSFTENNPELTEQYLNAHTKAIEFIEENPDESIEMFIEHIQELTGKELDFEETKRSLARLQPTYEINEEVIQEMADISAEAGYIDSNDIEGLINTEYIDAVVE